MDTCMYVYRYLGEYAHTYVQIFATLWRYADVGCKYSRIYFLKEHIEKGDEV